MSLSLEPIRAFKCTYKDCAASFDTEKAMKIHKKYSPEHDYCHKCDEDFEDYDDLAQHKAFRPDNHGKACRVCGEEFKSTSGLRRHIELTHKVDQKLTCIACYKEFYKASLLTEHLEFGYCEKITALQFQGHVVHKYLITELLKGGSALNRFLQKTSRYDAAIDVDDEGGVNIIDQDEDVVREEQYKAIQPEITPESLNFPKYAGPYPSLPSARKASEASDTLSSTFGNMSLDGESDFAIVRSTLGGKTPSATREVRAWNSGRTASTIFPEAKPTPATSEFSIQYHDDEMEHNNGINIMNTRFWDPISSDWNPERFLDTVTQKYSCPFTCEQVFDTPADLNRHIMNEHRITRMNCPSCLKYFKSCTALMSHCESRGSKCRINKADDYNLFLDKLTGGFLAVDEKTRPEFLHNPYVLVKNTETGKTELYQPPVASYLQYAATKPADWKEPRPTIQIGGIPSSQAQSVQGAHKHRSLW